MPMSPHSVDDALGRWSRRRFLARNALGLGSVSLAWLLREDNLLATPPNMPRQPESFDLKPKVPLLRPQARVETQRPRPHAGRCVPRGRAGEAETRLLARSR